MDPRELPPEVHLRERVTRIELALSAWEADVLPLNYTRDGAELTRRKRLFVTSPAASMPQPSVTLSSWVARNPMLGGTALDRPRLLFVSAHSPFLD